MMLFGARKPSFLISMPIASNPFVRKIRIKNGYRSEIVCAFWDDDAIDLALEMLKRHRLAMRRMA